MKSTQRNYRATFILDNRGKDDTIDTIISGVKQDITALAGVVGEVENLGRKEFARVTDKKFPGATYVQIAFAAPATVPAALRERLRLNPNVYRTFVQSA